MATKRVVVLTDEEYAWRVMEVLVQARVPHKTITIEDEDPTTLVPRQHHAHDPFDMGPATRHERKRATIALEPPPPPPPRGHLDVELKTDSQVELAHPEKKKRGPYKKRTMTPSKFPHTSQRDADAILNLVIDRGDRGSEPGFFNSRELISEARTRQINETALTHAMNRAIKRGEIVMHIRGGSGSGNTYKRVKPYQGQQPIDMAANEQ